MNKYKKLKKENKELVPSVIFDKNRNNSSKLRPFNEIKNDVGEVQYFPASSKEWKNSIYHFNPNLIKNFPIYDINIYKLIKSYFNMYFNYQFILNKYRSRRSKRLSLNKVYVSKPEIKHSNSKAIITIYTYNREKFSLLKKIKLWSKFTKKIANITKKYWFLIELTPVVGPANKKEKGPLFDIIQRIKRLNVNKEVQAPLFDWNLFIQWIFKKELLLLRKFKLRLNLNKYKFDDKFLNRLSKFISKLYNKKIEFNIVNLKSIVFNSDLFTEVSTLKIQKKKAKINRIMNIILNKAKLPKVNRIQEKGRIVKSVDPNLLENKYKNLRLNYIMKALNAGALNYNLDEILKDINYNIHKFSSAKMRKFALYYIIFNSLKYKNMGGIRLEVKGRLTRRYRADRAIYKLRWKGGLKNIDSSYKGLSVVKKRGHLNPNVEYSIFTSKRRIGAFAVKGWMSGK